MSDLDRVIDALEEMVADLRGSGARPIREAWRDRTQFSREDVVAVAGGGGGVPRATRSNVTSVPGSTSSVTLLSPVANRLHAIIMNDSNSRLFLKLGDTASLASFTVRLESEQFYEVPAGYTGIIDGIWNPVASGFALVTELTP